MLRSIALLGMSSLLVSCSTCRPTPPAEDPRYQTLGNVDIEIEVTGLRLLSGRLNDQLGASVRLRRSDRTSGEEGEGLSADYPEALRPRLMTITAPDSRDLFNATMCDRPRVPHECLFYVPGDLVGRPFQRRINVLFEDQRFGTAVIDVPAMDPMLEPAIVAPTGAPANQSRLSIQFRDVGADVYGINIMNCGEYEGDGISPCFDALDISLHRDPTGNLQIAPGSREAPRISMAEGIVRVESDAVAQFTESITYSVTAHRVERREGIPLSFQAGNSIALRR